MVTINTIDQLLAALDAATKKQIPEILKKCSFDIDALNQCATWSAGSYTRNCLKRTDSYELILICWDASAQTPIHDHGGQACWVYQLQGELTEIRYASNAKKELEETKRMVLQPNALTYMVDTMGYHQLCNTSNERGYTLHLYANPIDECEVYNKERACFETKEPTCMAERKNEG